MVDCIFCKVIAGEIPGKIVYKDNDIVVFYDINPKAPVHLLAVPVNHIESLRDISEADMVLLGKLMMTIKKVTEDVGIAKEGYKVVMNNGAGAGQLVFHMHAHILGGWRKAPGWEV